jgi:uroporphyrinogen-III synthase
MVLLVTRPAREAAVWVEQLQAQGLQATALPLIEIGPVADTRARDACLAQLQAHKAHGVHHYDAVMFVSANAVQFFMPPGTAWPQHRPVRAWSPGPGTAHALRERGVPPGQLDSPPEQAGQFDSEALWQIVAQQVRPGHRTLVVRGQDGPASPQGQGRGHGRDWLARQLQAAGGTVDFVAVYARHMPRWSAQQQAQALAGAQDGSVWLFSSAQAVLHLQQCLPGQHWQAARAVATHPRIADAARAAGFGVVRLSRPTLDDVVRVVASIESGA